MVTFTQPPTGSPENLHVFAGTPSRGSVVDGFFPMMFRISKKGDLKVQPFMFMGCKDLSTNQCAPSGRNDHISRRPFGTFESFFFRLSRLVGICSCNLEGNQTSMSISLHLISMIKLKFDVPPSGFFPIGKLLF